MEMPEQKGKSGRHSTGAWNKVGHSRGQDTRQGPGLEVVSHERRGSEDGLGQL